MSGRFANSWQLYRASWSVLRAERQLLVFPLISTIAALAVMATFALGAWGAWGLAGLQQLQDSRGHLPTMGYAALFAFYVVSYFIMFFFNAALVGATLAHFDGRSSSVGEALRQAAGKSGELLGYAVIAATVGVLLKALQERVGFLGRFVVGLLGTGWTLATFMVVPVLVARDVGPVDAVKESAGLLKRTWGENLVGNAGMGVAFFLMHLAVALVGVALVVGAVAIHSVVLAVLAAVLLVVAEVVLGLVHAALSGIYSAAVYRFATSGGTTDGFGDGVLQAAFRAKR
jgi:hypothetical protein